MSLGVDSLIVGYAASFPLIIETDQQCRAYIRDSFATVGEGGHLAHSSLMYREHDEVHTYSNALYAVYEAKKQAQRNLTVGEETALSVLHINGKHEILTLKGKKFFDEEFVTFGPKQITHQIAIPDGCFQPMTTYDDLKKSRPDLFPDVT